MDEALKYERYTFLKAYKRMSLYNFGRKVFIKQETSNINFKEKDQYFLLHKSRNLV